jgi:hypothetical protein
MLTEEGDELRALMEKFAAGEVTQADAKYLGQWAYATQRGKEGQKGTLARTRRKPD